jgi:ribose transport system substrate-binding protein
MKRVSSLLLAVCVATLIQGCDQGSQPTSATPQKKLRLGFVANNANDYWSIVRLGCDIAVSQVENVDLSFRTPSDHTAAAQQEIVNQMVADGIDGIAISPIDSEKEKDLLNSIPANILLVCADSDAPKSRRLCYIGTDNVAAGKQAAELLKAALPQGGQIVLLVGYPNAQNVAERIEGIKAGLAGSNLQIVDMLADEQKIPVAQKNAGDALAKYPDLAGVVGLNSYTGPAILQAVRSAGKVGKVQIVCFDEESDTLAGIAAGEIYGTVGQKPFAIGHKTISSMVSYLRGDKSQLAAGRVFIPTRVVTKDNVDFVLRGRKNILEN